MKRPLLNVFLSGAILAFSAAAHAQLVNCNVYLKGNYMEVGINNNGAVGSSYDPPTGYHPNATDTMYNDCTTFSFNVVQSLGFVVDGAQDGWTTGSPAYYGDYVTPHLAREGWAMSDVGASATAYAYHYASSSAGYTGPLSGSNIGYSASGSLVQGVWYGTFVGADTVDVRQTTTIDTGGLYMHVHIDFINVSVTTDTFYYMRTINPQNESVCCTDDTTMNIIEHQLPDPAGLVVVSATGRADSNAYIALGTKDPRARCFIIRDSVLPGFVPYASIWAGDTTHYKYADSLTSDVGIGLIYRLILGPGDSTSLDYAYTFRGSIIDSIFDSTALPLGHVNTHRQPVQAFPNPAAEHVSITGLTAGDSYAVYDIMGRQVLTAVASAREESVTIATLAPGIYVLTVRDADRNVIARIPIRKL